MAFVFNSWAQERVISGKVTATEDGSTIPGVNVVLKGTSNGTVTDSDGNFRLTTPASGGTLVFSFIGLATQEVAVGERAIINVAMNPDVQQLTEVVVTAQGLAKEKKALGYATTTVGTEQLSSRPVNDISRVLQGKVPGVVINPTGGVSGTGASINIRGYSTITGSSQPLWVVDGVPFNSSTNNNSGFSTGGAATSSSRFLDLDPNVIESISVLRGLAATTKYGDQGRNGVILVTTKSGNTKVGAPEINFQQTVSTTEIASWPDRQLNYGNGFHGLAGNTSPFYSNWGPNHNQIDSIAHPYPFSNSPELANAFPEFYFKRIPYTAAPDPIAFFRKGIVSNTSIGIRGGTDKLGYNTSVAYTTEEGYTPGNDLKRLNISTGFNAAVTNKLSIKSSLLYASSDMVTPPLNGATGGSTAFNTTPSLYANFLYTPTNYDVLNTSLFPFETPNDHRNIWYRTGNDIPNPNWVAKYMRDTDVTNRFFISSSISYDFNDNTSLLYRVGLDTYTQKQNREYNKGIGPAYANADRGIFQTTTILNSIWNHDLIFAHNRKITSDISLQASIGANARNDIFQRDGIYSEVQTVFGLMRHSNFETSSSRSAGFDASRILFREVEVQRYGIYGDFAFDYKNFFFINLQGRNDWMSTLEKENNSKFYPSVSTSLILTEVFPGLQSTKVNNLKFRYGFGTSAGFPGAYNTRNVVTQNLRAAINPAGSLVGEHTISNQLGNPLLKPELQTENEIGLEGKFFNNRIGIDFTVFDKGTQDLITDASIDPATGYTSTLINIGKISNKGIELGLTATPLKLSNSFQWDAILNYTLVRPEVIDLGTSITEVVLSGFTDRGNFAVPGQPMNIMKGSVISKDPNGNRIVAANGLYERSPQIGILGNPNADFFTTLINTFSYKGIEFAFQFDYRHGGDIYASTPSAVLGRGTTTAFPYNQDLSVILPGVKNVGTSDVPVYVKNDLQVSAADYGFNTLYGAGGTSEVFMFDGTTIRLREISIGYSFPKSLLSKTPIKNASIQINGNNLWFNAVNVPKATNYDPEVSSQGVDNGLGFDYLTGPSVKRYGAVLKLTF